MGLVLKPTSLIVFYEPRISSKFQTVDMFCMFLKKFEDLLSGSGAHSICLNYSFLEMLAIKLLKEENNRSYMYLTKLKDKKEYIVNCTVHSAVYVREGCK